MNYSRSTTFRHAVIIITITSFAQSLILDLELEKQILALLAKLIKQKERKWTEISENYLPFSRCFVNHARHFFQILNKVEERTIRINFDIK